MKISPILSIYIGKHRIVYLVLSLSQDLQKVRNFSLMNLFIIFCLKRHFRGWQTLDYIFMKMLHVTNQFALNMEYNFFIKLDLLPLE